MHVCVPVCVCVCVCVCGVCVCVCVCERVRERERERESDSPIAISGLVILQGLHRIVSRASPSPRVWSTSHHGFVSICHDFLGVLTTNDAHRRSCGARILTVQMHTRYGTRRIVRPEQRHGLPQTASNYYSHLVLLAHC